MFKLVFYYFIEAFFPGAEKDSNASLIRVDDYMSKVDQKMEDVSIVLKLIIVK